MGKLTSTSFLSEHGYCCTPEHQHNVSQRFQAHPVPLPDCKPHFLLLVLLSQILLQGQVLFCAFPAPQRKVRNDRAR